MASLQLEEFATALYMNLFDQSAGSELWRLFLTAPEVTGSRNAKSVKVRRLGAFTSALYGGAGSIDPTLDYQRPNDTTIQIDFNKTQLVPIGVDEIEHEMTALGVEGSKSALAMDGASAVRDAVVTDMLVTAEATATAVAEAPAATISAQVLIDAGKELDSINAPREGRAAIVDATRIWDLFDGTSQIGLGEREFASNVLEGRIPRLYGFDIFPTTLMPANTNVLAFHQSAVIAKAADELPKVKQIPDAWSIGDLLQVYLRYGEAVADTTRIRKHKTV